MEFDCLRREEENLATIPGFMLALQKLLRVRRGGLIWLGVPCATFCWMAKSCHQRSTDCPMGRPDSETVRLGNLLSCRSLLLVLIAAARGVYWFIEQPALSALEFFPYLDFAMRLKTLNCKFMDSSKVRWILACTVVMTCLLLNFRW